jgi:hypothetical protein
MLWAKGKLVWLAISVIAAWPRKKGGLQFWETCIGAAACDPFPERGYAIARFPMRETQQNKHYENIIKLGLARGQCNYSS